MALSQNELKQVTDLVMNRIRNTFARGEIKKVTNGKTAKAKIEFLSGEVYEGIEMPHQFGLQANPPVGSECYAFFLGGNRDHGSVIGSFNKQHSLTDLQPGESALFSVLGSKVLAKANGDISITTSNGSSVHVKNDGNISINSATAVAITSPSVTVSDDLHVGGVIHGTVEP